MAEGTLPGPGVDGPGAALAVADDAATRSTAGATRAVRGSPGADGHPAAGPVDRIAERLDSIDGRMRLLQDRFDDVAAQLRTLESDLADAVRDQDHHATKEWIAWAVATILVVILGVLWWVFKLYILPTHHQIM